MDHVLEVKKTWNVTRDHELVGETSTVTTDHIPGNKASTAMINHMLV